MNVKTSMSRCAPALSLSTSPGRRHRHLKKRRALGVFPPSASQAASKCASMIAFAFSNSASALCAPASRADRHRVAAEQRRRAGRPALRPRDLCRRPARSRRISSSRPSLAVLQRAEPPLDCRASRGTQTSPPAPSFSWMAASNGVSHGASTRLHVPQAPRKRALDVLRP